METRIATQPNKDLFTLSPKSLEEAIQYAGIISESELVPKDYRGKPGNVLVAVQMGAEIGLPPMQALQNIAVINGRPSVWGDALKAVVMAHPLCEYIKEWWDDKAKTAWCETKRVGQEPTQDFFSLEMAKAAGLLGKQGPWTQYKERMCKMRARGFCLRDTYPDVLKGIALAEEQRDSEREVNPQYSAKASASSLKAKEEETAPQTPPAQEAPSTPFEHYDNQNHHAQESNDLMSAETLLKMLPSCSSKEDFNDWKGQALRHPEGSSAYIQLVEAFNQHIANLKR